MKKIFFIIVAILLISVGFFSACKEKEALIEECKNSNRDGITGQWKLIEGSVRLNNSQPDVTDYSKENIIFDFQENNKLVVTGHMPDILGLFDDFQEGEHFYEYSKPNVCPTCMPGPNLFIDKPELGSSEGVYFCTALSDEETMSIVGDKVIGGVIDDAGFVTGGDYYGWGITFIKLN